MHYYNEFDPKKAAWLRELIAAGHIPSGFVDTRSIADVQPGDLVQYTSCHFFAGIGGWPYALRLAGWPDDLPVDTGSCPCQPFSCAGKRKGKRDKRHLWPVWARLIAQRKPSVIFGEQVASKAGRLWFSGIRREMEALDYEVGAADLCAAGVTAPHIRQRLYWVANASGSQWWTQSEGRRHVDHGENAGRQEAASRHPVRSQEAFGLENSDQPGRLTGNSKAAPPAPALFPGQPSPDPGLPHANNCHRHWWSGPLQVGWNCIEGEVERGGRKERALWRTQPGVPLLADGVSGRVAQLCGFGDAIVSANRSRIHQRFPRNLRRKVPTRHERMMNEKQRKWFMAELWPNACRAQGWNRSDNQKRYDLFARVLGDIPRHARTLAAGEHISFNHFDQADFDKVKAECLLLADNLKGAVETVRPDLGEERRLRHNIAEQVRCLAVCLDTIRQHKGGARAEAPAGEPGALRYIRPILEAKFKGKTRLEDLSAIPVLRDGEQKASELARCLMAMRTTVNARRNEADLTVHEMNLRARVPCYCTICVPRRPQLVSVSEDNQPF